MKQNIKDKVRAFWDANPCGTAFTECKELTKEFYDSIEQHRYQVDYYIPELINSVRNKYKRILEIGCGVGTDLRQFAEVGEVMGIDLSENSVRLAQQGFELFGYEGDFLIGDGENLGFKDNSFDFVYSLGVLHHTPNTQKAVDEIHRVLKPGGGGYNNGVLSLFTHFHSWYPSPPRYIWEET